MKLWDGGERFRLSVRGPDAVDLLHRVTSNEVRGLKPGDVNHQCLLNPKGGILSIFDLERLENGAILSGPIELRETTRAILERYIITESIELTELEALPGDGTSEDDRIRAGQPRWGVDVVEGTIPFEANLEEWVSTSKGCYTGQETIARIETYGEVARRLRLLVSDVASAVSGALTREGVAAGTITSRVSSTNSRGQIHAIGFVRRAHWAVGTVLEGPDGVTWTVEA